MKKREELDLNNKLGCLNKADDEELMFILLERDASTPVAIRSWIEHRIETGKNKRTDSQILEAEDCLRQIRNSLRNTGRICSLKDKEPEDIRVEIKQVRTLAVASLVFLILSILILIITLGAAE